MVSGIHSVCGDPYVFSKEYAVQLLNLYLI